jgi:hypothetical protein
LNASRPKLLRAGLLALACSAASAAPRSIEPFDASTWQHLQQPGTPPTAVVFTTTDCSHCPGAIDKLAQEIRRRKLDAQLVTVVMDGGGAELLHSAHYRQADRLLVFAGAPAALRYGVDPRWRGVTPYVALLNGKAPPVMKAGPPSDAAIDAWAQAAPAK